MHPEWATENLQVIRTLMERATVYRRALGPVMLTSGLVGVAASAIPCFEFFPKSVLFPVYWMSVSILSLGVGFILIRRQAIAAREAFWSPPTRRVFQALSPGLAAGFVAGCVFLSDHPAVPPMWVLPLVWMFFYGCALHAA